MAKKAEFVITNMVASAGLGLELDLFALAQKIKEIEYEPEQFPGAILKFKEPKASLLLFKNGKVVCVGGKKLEIVITNIVASANLNMELDLYRIAYKLPDVEYEPEQFPGAILKFKEPKVSLLLFKNGKVICAGAKTEKDIRVALQ